MSGGERPANEMAATSASHLSANHPSFHHTSAGGGSGWTGMSSSKSSPSGASSATTYLRPTSPAKNRRLSSADGYRPRVTKATGQKPACLVNASVTYCGRDQIYALRGFSLIIH